MTGVNVYLLLYFVPSFSLLGGRNKTVVQG